MDFALSEEQGAIIDTTRAFAADRLAPGYASRDRAGVLARDIAREMGALGLIAPEMPESLGGSGLDYLTSALILEAIAEGDFNVSYIQLLASLNCQILDRYATPDLAQKWIPAILKGDAYIAVALTEPGGGSDAANLQLKAEKVAGGYRLNGEKTSISMADQADIIITFARTGTRGSRAAGISAFIVEAPGEGLKRTRFDDIGERAIGRGSLFFDDFFVPDDHRLGEEDRAFSQVMEGFDFSRALIGLQCLALARISLDETWAYIQERNSFGKPIAANQGVTFPLAECETQYEAARLLCLKTLWLKDNGLPHTKEAAMCKWWAPKLAFDIVQQCLLLHGHGGYSTDLPFEQRLRDVLGLQIGDGTAQIMKMVIARVKTGETK